MPRAAAAGSKPSGALQHQTSGEPSASRVSPSSQPPFRPGQFQGELNVVPHPGVRSALRLMVDVVGHPDLQQQVCSLRSETDPAGEVARPLPEQMAPSRITGEELAHLTAVLQREIGGRPVVAPCGMTWATRTGMETLPLTAPPESR